MSELRYADALSLPDGWFFLGLSSELAVGAVSGRKLAGRDYVLWRGADGVVGLNDAYCPHLGAHLAHGGRVRGCELECPFHGFRFNREGTCTATGYGSKPPGAAKLGGLPVIERHGLILAWWSATARTAAWQPPEVDMTGWSPFTIHRWSLRGHPQETTENSVDIGHFPWIHGYRDVESLAPMATTGPHLHARYGFTRPLIGGWMEPSVREIIDVHVWGLGYSRVEVDDRSFGIRMRLLVMPTPTDHENIDLQIGISMLDPGLCSEAPFYYRWLPAVLTRFALQPLLLRTYAGEVEQDFAIWKHKTYIQPPALALGDGPVGRYRAWVKQFYSESAA